MKNLLLALAMSVSVLACRAAVAASAVVGQPAPDFTLTDTAGAARALSSYRGQTVVLEWVNYDCPFVRKHYESGNMQKLQKGYTGKGVVWLQVSSSAAGKQGHYPPARAAALSKERNVAATAYLLDTDGKVGKSYGARTTPHMYVIDPQGKLVYAGGIDDTPSADVEDIATAKNLVAAALDETLAGRPVSVAMSEPYGCAVKY